MTLLAIIPMLMSVCNIPVDSPRVPDGTSRPSPAWLRPVRKRYTPSPSATRDNSSSPAAAAGMQGGFGEDIMSANLSAMMPPDSLLSGISGIGGLEGYAAQVEAEQRRQSMNQSQQQSQQQPSTQRQDSFGQSQPQNTSQGQMADTNTPNTTAAIDALFNTNDFFNVEGSSGTGAGDLGGNGMAMDLGMDGQYNDQAGRNQNMSQAQQSGPNMTLYTGSNAATSPYNDFAMLATTGAYGQPHGQRSAQQNGGDGQSSNYTGHNNGEPDFTLPEPPSNGNGLAFDFSTGGGFGGEVLGGEGMDNVTDLQGGEQGL